MMSYEDTLISGCYIGLCCKRMFVLCCRKFAWNSAVPGVGCRWHKSFGVKAFLTWLEMRWPAMIWQKSISTIRCQSSMLLDVHSEMLTASLPERAHLPCSVQFIVHGNMSSWPGGYLLTDMVRAPRRCWKHISDLAQHQSMHNVKEQWDDTDSTWKLCKEPCECYACVSVWTRLWQGITLARTAGSKDQATIVPWRRRTRLRSPWSRLGQSLQPLLGSGGRKSTKREAWNSSKWASSTATSPNGAWTSPCKPGRARSQCPWMSKALMISSNWGNWQARLQSMMQLQNSSYPTQVTMMSPNQRNDEPSEMKTRTWWKSHGSRWHCPWLSMTTSSTAPCVRRSCSELLRLTCGLNSNRRRSCGSEQWFGPTLMRAKKAVLELVKLKLKRLQRRWQCHPTGHDSWQPARRARLETLKVE